MSVQLKVKAKTLAVEASYIRKEEYKMKRQARWFRDHQQDDASQVAYLTFWNLQDHRKVHLRQAARATHLARAFLAGQAYADIEHKRLGQYEKVFNDKIIPEIVRMVKKYGPSTITEDQVGAWLNV